MAWWDGALGGGGVFGGGVFGGGGVSGGVLNGIEAGVKGGVLGLGGSQTGDLLDNCNVQMINKQQKSVRIRNITDFDILIIPIVNTYENCFVTRPIASWRL